MTQSLGIGIGAGLVSALLFGVLVKETALAFALNLLSPLPILIVGLGWSHRAALAAALTGSLALALAVSLRLGLGFAVYLALPAWWLAYLALLGRADARGGMEWYPTGRLLGWVGATAGLAVAVISFLSSPSFEAYQTRMRGLADSIVQIQMGAGPVRRPEAPTDAGATPETNAEANASKAESADAQAALRTEIADTMVRLVPGIAGTGLALLLAFYLWAAARIVRVSGRLPRPWPDIPATLMPRALAGLFVAAVALGAVGPGYAGVLGFALVGALSAVFALQGLAAFHDRSRGRPGRGVLLAMLYVILFATQGIAFVALTLFGLADTALNRRRREHPTGDAT